MKKLVNVNQIPTVDFLKRHTEGKFRFITTVKAGFLSISDARDFDNPRFLQNPDLLLSQYKKGALHTIQFCPEGSEHYLTVFARKGKRIHLIDEAILESLTVGTINQYWYGTDLYSQTQYAAVNSKTWADYAYVDNTIAGVDFTDSLKALEALSI